MRSIISAILLFLIGSSGVAQPPAMEWLLEFERTYQEFSPTGEEIDSGVRALTLRLGAHKIRRDGGRESFLLDRGKSLFYLIDHEKREVYTFEAPVQRDEILSDLGVKVLRSMADEIAARITETEQGETRTMELGGVCQEHRLRISGMGDRIVERITACLARELGPDDGLYWRLMLDRSQLFPGREFLWEHFADLGGWPLSWQNDSHMAGRMSRLTITLTSIRQVPPDPAAYALPPDYARVTPDSTGRFLSRALPIP